MEQEMKKEALEFLRSNPICHMATVEDNQPYSRVMWTAAVDEDFTLWYTSPASSHKMKQFEKNPSVCVTVYQDQADTRIFGKVTAIDDPALKSQYWKDEWKVYFPKGKEDPEYQLLKIQPKTVEYRDLKKSGMRVAKVV